MTYTFAMDFEYDSWNRMLSMTYPDGEVVSYGYDCGGNLKTMIGMKNGRDYSYISDLIYNVNGQRSRIDYGDGSYTNYKYDNLQRLKTLRSYTAAGTAMQNITYTYDKMSNVTQMANTAGAVNGLGGSYTNSYAYDALYRLTDANQSYGIGNSLTMRYSADGRVNVKNQVFTRQEALFGYCVGDKPHAPRRIYNYNTNVLTDLQWDGNGNMGQVNSYENGDYSGSRYLYWTSDNRLHTTMDGSKYCYYAYDANGERVLKMSGDCTFVDVNANTGGGTVGQGTIQYAAVPDNVTLYTSPYLVASNTGYTKHYYAGTERLCARIGNGGLRGLAVSSGWSVADDLYGQCREAVMGNRTLAVTDPGCVSTTDGNSLEELTGSVAAPAYPTGDAEGDVRVFSNNLRTFEESTGAAETAYFYHGDHLDSAAWITSGGAPVQHLQYCPYGEPFVNQRTSSYNERFTFTGKERDEETGYGYFGARYLDADLLTGWLSVDPMADKYPSLSPYNYCAWNPIKLVDPNGRDWYDVDEYGTVKKNEEKSKECQDKDILYSTKTSESVTLKKGTIDKNYPDYSILTDDNKEIKGQVLSLHGDSDDRLRAFEFVSDNTNVEWSLISFSNNEEKSFYMTNSHSTGEEHVTGARNDRVGDIIVDQVTTRLPNCVLVSRIHNHQDFYQNPPSPSDKNYAKAQSNANHYIYFSNQKRFVQMTPENNGFIQIHRFQILGF